jgi:hypothetical protein
MYKDPTTKQEIVKAIQELAKICSEAKIHHSPLHQHIGKLLSLSEGLPDEAEEAMRFHGFGITLDVTPGDPSEEDHRFREDAVTVTGVKIIDEYEVCRFFDDHFSEEITIWWREKWRE